MLRVLLASQPVRAGWLGGTTFSTVTHGALIAMAVVATNHVRTVVREDRAASPTEHIVYVEPSKLAEALRARETSRAIKKAVRKAPLKLELPDVGQFQEQIADMKIPDVTAAPDLTAVTDAWLAAPDSISASGTSLTALLLAKAAFVPPTNGVYTEDMVERSVEARRGNPKPRYPSVLANMGIEGDFVVRFVVDTTGTVTDDKIEFPSAMHRLFVSAVRTALLKSRYLPARVGGHAVAQQVMQEFRFRIGGR
jgi:TonB family protein